MSKGLKRAANGAKKPKPVLKLDEEISSGSEDQFDGEEESDSEEESAESKRKRIAKEYLADIKDEEEEDDDGEDDNAVHANSVTDKLQRKRLESSGKLYRTLAPVAQELTKDDTVMRRYSGHSGPITCLVLSKDEKKMFSGSKDNSLIMWDVESGKKTEIKPKWSRARDGSTQSHSGELLALALSFDSRFLVSGGRDNIIRVFDSRKEYKEVQVLKGHRDAICGLTFQANTHTLFSASQDRCIKHWDLDEMGYIETLFGHQDGVNALVCFLLFLAKTNIRIIR